MLSILTIFIGSFLVFLIQPLIGNTLLPVFGGTASVWSTCLASFQILLVGGYFYAHLIGRVGNHVKSGVFHVLFLVLSIGWLIFSALKYTTVLGSINLSNAAWETFLAISMLIAIPYIVLSANSSIVQLLSNGKYKLYAISNLGSILGLLAYPFLFEPYLTVSSQWVVFVGITILYTLLFSGLIFFARLKKNTKGEIETDNYNESRPSSFEGIANSPIVLSFISCFTLNAISTHLCTDITPLPMLWAGILSVYLLSYVFAFSDGVSRFAPWCGLIVVPIVVYGMWHLGVLGYTAFKPELYIGFSVLFLGGLIVHSRLYRCRPNASKLTRYYLHIAVGGAIGGVVASFLMMRLSYIVIEYPIALSMLLVVVSWDLKDAIKLLPRQEQESIPRNFICCIYVAIACVTLYGVYRGHNAEGYILARYRNFYGIGYVARKVMRVNGGWDYLANEFRSNGTIHGFQKVDRNRSYQNPTVYYTENAGGLPFQSHYKVKSKEPIRVALCGMGIGTLATYSKENDFFRFYEINPDVVKLATNTNLFTFISQAKGTIDIVVDDARCALEKERTLNEEKYDIIVVDVFNGDAIPPHVASREAFSLYLDRLAAGGIIAVHLSNWHLDLLPMVKAASKEFGLNIEAYNCMPTLYSYVSTWAFLSRDPLPNMFDETQHERVNFDNVKDIPMMRDDFHSLLPYINLTVSSKKER